MSSNLVKKIVIETPLNIMKFNKQREEDPEWIIDRLTIMNQYTSRSIAAQTNHDFEWHILIRHFSEKELREIFPTKWPANMKFITMEEQPERIKQLECDQLLMVRLNSDDCYRINFIQFLYQFPYELDKEALVFQNGYMLYQKEKIIVEREFASPPFYALIYDWKKYCEGFRYEFGGHNYLRSRLNTRRSVERLWLWLVHESNNKITRGSSYPDWRQFEQVDFSVISKFGLE